MILIDEKSRDRVEFALDELIKLTKISSQGSIEHTDNFKYLQCLYILSHAIKIDVIKEYDFKENLIRTSFNIFRKDNNLSFNRFKEVIKQQINQSLNASKKSFHVLFQLNIKPDMFNRKKLYSICGDKIHCHTWRYINSNFAFDKFTKDAEYRISTFRSISLDDFAWFEVIGEGKHIGECFSSAYKKFELFRAILNFSNNAYVIHNQSGDRSYLNSFLPSPFYVIFNPDKSYNQFRYELTEFKYKTVNLMIHFKPTVFKKLLALFLIKPSEDSLKWLILEAVSKYGTSLDSLEWDTNFLKLWQVLELITFQSEKTSIKNVGDKIKLIFGQQKIWNYTIDIMCELRNSLVHKGNFPGEGLGKLNILKFLVENCIFHLIQLSHHFKSESDLEMFHQLLSQPSGNLKKQINIANKIIKFRGTKIKARNAN
ncbi:MAG: hypothetical protein HY811_02645 [Planctomycetes bacterium]|nr:hypothetical protein [Planctomycetota bacterium]